MKHVRLGVLLASCLAVAVGVAQPALAQSAPPSSQSSSPAVSPDVQQVRDELARLRKEFEALRQQYDGRLIALEQRLSQIGGGPSVVESAESAESPTPTPVVAQAPAAPTQVAPGASKVFNPDTSVIANFVGVGGKNHGALMILSGNSLEHALMMYGAMWAGVPVAPV